MAEEKEFQSENTEAEEEQQEHSALQEEQQTNENDSNEDNQENSTVEQLELQLSEAKDKYLRLFAEFENFRKRTAREKQELVKTASSDVLLEILPILDDFERSLEIFRDNEAVKPMYEGIELVHSKLLKALEGQGLKVMDVEKGTEFDSEFHEAIAQSPAPEPGLKGKVIDVVDQGYFIGDKVLRFAKVVTGS